MKLFACVTELAVACGQTLGKSGWLTVTQEMVDDFAEVTGDQQWIHTDVERATEGPYGGTVAHGYLVLSLIPTLVAQVFTVEGVGATINYGLEKVRFPAPVPVGSKIRVEVTPLAVESGSGGACQVRLRSTVEVEGQEKPACVAETIRRYTRTRVARQGPG